MAYNPFKKEDLYSMASNLSNSKIGKAASVANKFLTYTNPLTAQAKVATDIARYWTNPKQQVSSSQAVSSQPNASYEPKKSPLASYNPPGYKPPALPKYNKPETTTPSTPSYINNAKNLTDRMKEQSEARKQRMTDYNTARFDERGRLLNEAIPNLQNQFSKAEGYFQKGMANAQQRAGYQKQNVQDETGAAERQAAQVRNENEARAANRFAGLNTTDSYGFGSHQQAQENIDSDFNKFVQEGLRAKEQQLFEIDSALQDYELSAQQELDGLRVQLENTVAQIQSDLRMNDLDKQNAIAGVIEEYENNINTIDEYMNNAYKEYDDKLLELEKTTLSKQFMETGEPQNEVDYKYFIDNYDAYKDVLDLEPDKNAANKQSALNLVDDLLAGGVDAISGAFRPGNIPGLRQLGGGEAATKWEGLQSLLALAARDQLKGTGTVSDFEAEMLKKAALAGLDPSKQSEQAFRAGLEELKKDLVGGGAISQAGNASYDPMGIL